MQIEANKETSVMTESRDVSIMMGLEREPAKTELQVERQGENSKSLVFTRTRTGRTLKMRESSEFEPFLV